MGTEESYLGFCARVNSDGGDGSAKMPLGVDDGEDSSRAAAFQSTTQSTMTLKKMKTTTIDKLMPRAHEGRTANGSRRKRLRGSQHKRNRRQSLGLQSCSRPQRAESMIVDAPAAYLGAGRACAWAPTLRSTASHMCACGDLTIK